MRQLTKISMQICEQGNFLYCNVLIISANFEVLDSGRFQNSGNLNLGSGLRRRPVGILRENVRRCTGQELDSCPSGSWCHANFTVRSMIKVRFCLQKHVLGTTCSTSQCVHSVRY